MFTGLVEGVGVVRDVERRGSGMRLVLAPPAPDFTAREGQSIALAGACLTVIGARDPSSGTACAFGTAGADLVFDVSAETLERTWFGDLARERGLNVERALRLGDRLDGHLVAGHVDGRALVAAIADAGDGGATMTFEVERGLERWLVDKGSVTIDGVSLTVVAPLGSRFDVALIPATLAKTTLGRARVGDAVNVEADMIGKWVERLAAR